MQPKQYDLIKTQESDRSLTFGNIYEGFEFTCVMTETDGTVIDGVNYIDSVDIQFRNTPTDTEVLKRFSLAGATVEIVNDTPYKKVRLKRFPVDIRAGKCYYDVLINFSNIGAKTYIGGEAFVNQVITR